MSAIGRPNSPEHHMEVLHMLPLDVFDIVWEQIDDDPTDVCFDAVAAACTPTLHAPVAYENPEKYGNKGPHLNVLQDCTSYEEHRLALDDGRAAFKLVSKRSSELVDSLVTTCSITFSGPATPINSDAPPLGWRHAVLQLISRLLPSYAAPLAGVAPQAISADPERHSAVQQVCYSARLPRLASLRLCRWSSEADLKSCLRLLALTTQQPTRDGAAPISRVTALALSGPPLTASVISAALRAFPRLHSLRIHESFDYVGPAAAGLLFQGLHGGSITKLVLSSLNSSANVVRSLAGLVSLRHLAINCVRFDMAHLMLLSGLVHLEHFALCSDALENGETPVHLPALLLCTRLTFLRILPLDDYDSHDNWQLPAYWLAVSRLSGLRQLVTLDLGPLYTFWDHSYAHLRQLSQLTSLSCGALENLQGPADPAGCLPLLQRLRLHWPLEPVHVLSGLLPLLPLPSLVDAYIAVHTDVLSAAHAAQEVVALAAVAQHLAAAPRLLRKHARLGFPCWEARARQLSATQLQGALQVLQAQP